MAAWVASFLPCGHVLISGLEIGGLLGCCRLRGGGGPVVGVGLDHGGPFGGFRFCEGLVGELLSGGARGFLAARGSGGGGGSVLGLVVSAIGGSDFGGSGINGAVALIRACGGACPGRG